MFTRSEENYLKAIFHLEAESNKGVSTNAIAQKMGTKASSVTDMVKKLSEKGVVEYKKYQGVQLSDAGKKIAVYIIRKHRLWECFLYDKLQFSWDEVHDIAEQLEHIKSEALIDRLEAFLEFPTVDPHGDPIPDKNGNINHSIKQKLSEIQVGQETQLVSVDDSSDGFLKYLTKKNIAIGQSIRVKSIESFDKTMVIEIDDEEMTISEVVANNLLVKVLN